MSQSKPNSVSNGVRCSLCAALFAICAMSSGCRTYYVTVVGWDVKVNATIPVNKTISPNMTIPIAASQTNVAPGVPTCK